MMKTYMILLFNNLSIENSDSYFKCAISGHRKESQKTKWYMVDNVTLDFFICPTIIFPYHLKKGDRFALLKEQQVQQQS